MPTLSPEANTRDLVYVQPIVQRWTDAARWALLPEGLEK